MHKNYGFTETRTQFYSGQILLALEYLHHLGIMHRDVRPEHILIDGEGYAKLTGFQFAKRDESKTQTMCGSDQYMAPEVIRGRAYDKAAEYWGFGVLLYEMRAGIPPFYGGNVTKVYEKITSAKFKCPSTFSSKL